MVDRFKQVQEAAEAAAVNGWTTLDNTGLRRVAEHSTPQFAIDADWWTPPTYTTVEFLSFVFSSRTRVPKVIYGVCNCPWVGRSDQRISFQRTLELLAQPLELSGVHNRD